MNPATLMLTQSAPEFVNGLLSSYQTFKHYENESRKLEVEIESIEKQTEVKLEQIHSGKDIRLAELENQRYALELNYQEWLTKFQNQAIDQQVRNKSMLFILEQMSQPGADTKALIFAYEMTLKASSEHSHQSHKALMQLSDQSLAILDSGLKRLK